MRIALAADHAGYELKERLESLFKDRYEILDLGTFDPSASDDYPDFAASLGAALLDGKADRGILICGSGVGASVAANKIKGIRAGLCHDAYSAQQGVEHDDMNVLVLGSRVIGSELARTLVEAYLKANFSGEERHLRRLRKVKAIEATGRPSVEASESA
jgi:RpiB/LacA/LacB family sugar-phosphate isomerase